MTLNVGDYDKWVADMIILSTFHGTVRFTQVNGFCERSGM